MFSDRARTRKGSLLKVEVPLGSHQISPSNHSTFEGSNMLGENYAHRRRKEPTCGLALSCLKQQENTSDLKNKDFDDVRIEMLDSSETPHRLKRRQQSKKNITDSDPTLIKYEDMGQEVQHLSAGSLQKLQQPQLMPVQSQSQSRLPFFRDSNPNHLLSGAMSDTESNQTDQSRLLSLFRIPSVKLKQFHSQEDKLDYIIEHMQSNIRDGLRQLEKNEQERQQNIKMFRKNIKDQFNDELFKGLYSWLNVNCPQHKGLVKKLRTKLIETLQTVDLKERPKSAAFDPKKRYSSHYQKIIKENPGQLLICGKVLQEAIENTFKDFVREHKPQLLEHEKPHERWTEKKQSVFGNTLLSLNEMMLGEGEKNGKRRPKTAAKKETFVLNTLKNDAVQQFFDTLPVQSWEDVKEKEKRQQIETLMEQFIQEEQSKDPNTQRQWKEELEVLFQKHKSEIRLGLTKFATTGPWNKVVLGQMDQLRADLPKTTTQKDLRKAYEGMKYGKVLDTVQAIPSLNECLDKKAFQKKINNLPIEHFDKVEGEIAEDILKTYASKKSKYQQERNQFFKKNVVKSEEKIKINEEKFIHRIQSQQRKGEYSKLSKRYRTILTGLEKGSISLKQNKNDPLVRLYKDRLGHFKEPKPLLMKAPQDDLAAKIAIDFFDQRGRLAPPAKYDRRIPQKYFIEKYAGGPTSNEEARGPVSVQTMTKAAVVIQKLFKKWKAKKLTEEKKQERDRQQFWLKESARNQKKQVEKEQLYRSQSKPPENNIETSFKSSSSPDPTQTSSSIHLRRNKYKTQLLKLGNETFLHNRGKSLYQQSQLGKDMSTKYSKVSQQTQPQQTFNSPIQKDVFEQPHISNINDTYKTNSQLKRSLGVLVNNVFEACKKNNHNYIEKVKQRVNVSALCSRDAHQNTPLYIAVANRHLDTVRYLIERGVPVNQTNSNSNTAMHKAFMNQDYTMIALLQMKGASLQSVNEFGQTPLYFGSKSLLAKLGVQSLPTNFVSQKDPLSKRSTNNSKLQTLSIPNSPVNQMINSGKHSVQGSSISQFKVKGNMNPYAPLFGQKKASID